jgi:hypothetical protein
MKLWRATSASVVGRATNKEQRSGAQPYVNVLVSFPRVGNAGEQLQWRDPPRRVARPDDRYAGTGMARWL